MADRWKRNAIEAIEAALSALDFVVGDERFNKAIGCAIADMTEQRDRLQRELDRPRRKAKAGKTQRGDAR